MAVKTPAVIPRLRTRYEEEIRSQLVERYGLRSVMEAPRLEKITLNMGVGDAKQDSRVLEQAGEQLAIIAGQAPSERRARRSIAGFKIRDGMPIGVAVTLRNARMYEFLDRLTAIALPRVRDFRGLNPRAFDGRGNYSLGIREQIIFPEIDYDAIDQVRGLDVAITTSTDSDAQAFFLLRELGMPFQREGGPEDAAARRRDEEDRGGPSQADAISPADQPPDAEAVPSGIGGDPS
jgi:large subunit ribosomal protein L5